MFFFPLQRLYRFVLTNLSTIESTYVLLRTLAAYSHSVLNIRVRLIKCVKVNF